MPLSKSRPYPIVGNNLRESPIPSSTHSRSIFSRRSRSDSPTPSSSHRLKSNRPRRGFFRSRNSSDSSVDSPEHRRGGGYFHLGNGNAPCHDSDPIMLAARQKVTDAEEAEKEADKALKRARETVKEARKRGKIPKQEAVEE